MNPTSTHPSESGRMYQGVLQPKSFPPLPESWDSEWETLRTADGLLQLYSVTHHQKNWKSPKALLIVHGQGEHGGRYLHVPHYVASQVDSVTCLDLRGHGRSEGLRGHVQDFDLYVNDVVLAIQHLDETLRKRFGTSEIHLLGHSMGGLIALRLGFLFPNLPLRSVSISAPLLGIQFAVPPWKDAAATLLSKVWGSFHMTSDLDPGFLSHDQDLVEAYRADRLVHGKGTPAFYVSLKRAMSDTLSRHAGFHYPALFLIPMQDRIVKAELTLDFFRKLKHRDKLLKTYPEFYHECLNELGKDQVFQDLSQWIQSHSL